MFRVGLRLLGAAVLLLVPISAMGAGGVPVASVGAPRYSVESNGTVSVTNTFQQVFGQDTGGNRVGCKIFNTSAHTIYVFFGPIANATTSNAIPIPAYSASSPSPYVGCNDIGVVLQDQVSVTGTAGDTFVSIIQ